MRKQTCCFTGHRKIPPSEHKRIVRRLRKEIIQLIRQGVIYYGAGGALGFDTLAAQTVLELRKKYPQVRLILVLPCPEQAEKWSKGDIEVYKKIKSQSDKIVYVSNHYTPDCMLRRNRHLAEHSCICVCYQTANIGGTAYTTDYARSQGLRIINIAQRRTRG